MNGNFRVAADSLCLSFSGVDVSLVCLTTNEAVDQFSRLSEMMSWGLLNQSQKIAGLQAKHQLIQF